MSQIKYRNTEELTGTDSTDTNGCSVYSLAATCDMSYQDAMRTAMELFFRSKRKGARTSMITTAFETKLRTGKLINGNKVVSIDDRSEQRMEGSGRVQLGWYVKNVAKEGKYYILVKQHAVAVIDGVIHDNMPEGFSTRRIVNFAVKLERVVEAE